MHFEQAGEADKAIDYYAAGAHHALDQNAIQEAYSAFDRAAFLLAQQSAAGADAADAANAKKRLRQQVEVQLGRARSGYAFLAPEEQSESLERIVADADALGDLALIAEVHLHIALIRLQDGDSPDAPLVKRSLDRIATAADALGDQSLRATPLALIGLSQIFAGSSVQAGIDALEAGAIRSAPRSPAARWRSATRRSVTSTRPRPRRSTPPTWPRRATSSRSSMPSSRLRSCGPPGASSTRPCRSPRSASTARRRRAPRRAPWRARGSSATPSTGRDGSRKRATS
jgi:hypothetical protein